MDKLLPLHPLQLRLPPAPLGHAGLVGAGNAAWTESPGSTPAVLVLLLCSGQWNSAEDVKSWRSATGKHSPTESREEFACFQGIPGGFSLEGSLGASHPIPSHQRDTCHQPSLLQVHLEKVRMGMGIYSKHSQGMQCPGHKALPLLSSPRE